MKHRQGVTVLVDRRCGSHCAPGRLALLPTGSHNTYCAFALQRLRGSQPLPAGAGPLCAEPLAQYGVVCPRAVASVTPAARPDLALVRAADAPDAPASFTPTSPSAAAPVTRGRSPSPVARWPPSSPQGGPRQTGAHPRRRAASALRGRPRPGGEPRHRKGTRPGRGIVVRLAAPRLALSPRRRPCRSWRRGFAAG